MKGFSTAAGTKFDDLIPSLLEGKGDVAAGFITITEERQKKVTFTKPYLHNVSEVLVAYRGIEDVPASLEELSGKTVHVLRDSSFGQHLADVNRRLLEAGRSEAP
jgi:ABC-type amino acid transport substrate-binding protein